jgi:uncharacterized GH25 family protein
MAKYKLDGLLLLFALLVGSEAVAHTLFINPDSFTVEPGSTLTVKLIDGTFVTSESRLQQSSIRAAEIIGPNESSRDLSDEELSYSGKMTLIGAEFESPGTYLIGVSTRPRKIVLEPDMFNFYLRYEGLFDEQQERVELEESNVAVVEKYSKFAKALVQVGDTRTSNYSQEIGFDVEIVPLTNPYSLGVGDVFRAKILRDGKPLPGELVYATHENHYSADEEGIFDEAVKVRSDGEGLIEFPIEAAGKWYVRFIDLERLDDSEYWYSSILVALGAQEQQISYESKWATLTFEIR